MASVGDHSDWDIFQAESGELNGIVPTDFVVKVRCSSVLVVLVDVPFVKSHVLR